MLNIEQSGLLGWDGGTAPPSQRKRPDNNCRHKNRVLCPVRWRRVYFRDPSSSGPRMSSSIWNFSPTPLLLRFPKLSQGKVSLISHPYVTLWIGGLDVNRNEKTGRKLLTFILKCQTLHKTKLLYQAIFMFALRLVQTLLPYINYTNHALWETLNINKRVYCNLVVCFLSNKREQTYYLLSFKFMNLRSKKYAWIFIIFNNTWKIIQIGNCVIRIWNSLLIWR